MLFSQYVKREVAVNKLTGFYYSIFIFKNTYFYSVHVSNHLSCYKCAYLLGISKILDRNAMIWLQRFMNLLFSIVQQLISVLISFLCISEQLFVVVLSENSTGGTTQKNPHELNFTRHKILTAQFECYQKIMKDTNHNKTGERFSFHRDPLLRAS